eukprot:TRINITY_DN3272_c0_g1_i1.p1 TRINITY_DN3272_c0_g1~~TRINITY_DN3272_c0_g1_i1.p1  ORF type:complete len:1086 (-),score=159.79 TRINITY_DN3272_c0_g1_i1:66-3323(-)
MPHRAFDGVVNGELRHALVIDAWLLVTVATFPSGRAKGCSKPRCRRWVSLFYLFMCVVGDGNAATVPSSTVNVETISAACYKFYGVELFHSRNIVCPSRCPLRATCRNDGSRSACVNETDCPLLMERGQEATLALLDAVGVDQPTRACIACGVTDMRTLNGCRTCVGGVTNGSNVIHHNGTISGLRCDTCSDNFALDTEEGGLCLWDRNMWTAFFILVLFVLIALVVWVIFDVCEAACSKTTNSKAIQRGLMMRRRAKLFKVKKTMNGSCQLELYKLNANLHSRNSACISGPGLVIFMNWFPYCGLVCLWLAMGVFLFGPKAGEDELSFLDPCQQLERAQDGWNFNHPSDREGKQLKLFMWNYFGTCLLSMAFWIYQTRLWTNMVVDSRRPSLREYCIEMSGLPPELTDKVKIRDALGDWMEKINLNREGIVHISIAYNVPPDKAEEMQHLVDLNLRKAVQEHGEKFDSKEASVVNGAPTPAILSREAEVEMDTDEDVDEVEATSKTNGGRFWIRLIAAVMFQLPFEFRLWQFGAFEASPIVNDVQDSVAQEFLKGLQGSGYVYVVLDTEALAYALGGMGVARMPDISPTPITVRVSPKEPLMIRWQEYNKVPLALMIWRVVKAVVVLYLALMLWLAFFSTYLNFELFTSGSSSATKSFMGTFVVGLLVPIGNALIGVLVDMMTETIGFKDEETMRLIRLILNVAINACANFGEVYLVHRKVYNSVDTNLLDIPWSIMKAIVPVGIDPMVQLFQEELLSILWPSGVIVPVFAIPLLLDVFPLTIGMLRLKRDMRLTAAEAERILKPNSIDINSPYCDVVIQLVLLAGMFWLSPGRYLFVLSLAVAMWTTLVYLNVRMNVLRWQAFTYFGGRVTHDCASYLMALPLGLFCAAFDRKLYPSHTGKLGFTLHVVGHFIFIRYVLPKLGTKRVSRGTRYDEMMREENAPLATFRNTNPIEVLKSIYMPEERDPDLTAPLIYFRTDKAYLQASASTTSKLFAGEKEQEDANLVALVKSELGGLARSSVAATVDQGRHISAKGAAIQVLAGRRVISLAERMSRKTRTAQPPPTTCEVDPSQIPAETTQETE